MSLSITIRDNEIAFNIRSHSAIILTIWFDSNSRIHSTEITFSTSSSGYISLLLEDDEVVYEVYKNFTELSIVKCNNESMKIDCVINFLNQVKEIFGSDKVLLLVDLIKVSFSNKYSIANDIHTKFLFDYVAEQINIKCIDLFITIDMNELIKDSNIPDISDKIDLIEIDKFLITKLGLRLFTVSGERTKSARI